MCVFFFFWHIWKTHIEWKLEGTEHRNCFKRVNDKLQFICKEERGNFKIVFRVNYQRWQSTPNCQQKTIQSSKDVNVSQTLNHKHECHPGSCSRAKHEQSLSNLGKNPGQICLVFYCQTHYKILFWSADWLTKVKSNCLFKKKNLIETKQKQSMLIHHTSNVFKHIMIISNDSGCSHFGHCKNVSLKGLNFPWHFDSEICEI